MSLSRRIILLGLTLPLLSACGEVRQELGFGRNVPDEFAVVDRAPLSIPPDYTLRPPRPGASRPQDIGTDRQASEVVFGSKKGKATSKVSSASEQAILEASGADKADPNIRETVDRETSQKVVADEHLVQKLLNWNSKPEPPATAVDPVAEADRIKKAKENNEPITTGATPVIEKEKTGWLGL
ncbi:MAG: DUF3035 domain-containing protein [Alphaproteobacteria bacterium]|nr:DUF3035 domain-containing protein [Alphaproteobacteria bacterium]